MNLMTNAIRVALVALILGFTGGGLAGCEDEGPFEETGEEIDEAAEEAAEETEEAADEMSDDDY